MIITGFVARYCFCYNNYMGIIIIITNTTSSSIISIISIITISIILLHYHLLS